MSEPVQPPPQPTPGERPLEPLPTVGEPFAAAPRPVRGKGGCGRVALIGCGVLVLLMGIAAVLFLVKAPAMLAWIFGKFEEQVERSLPADLPAEERQRLEEAFRSLDAAIRTGDVDALALQRLQQRLLALTQKMERGLEREDVRELTLLLEGAAGKEAGDGDAPRPPPAEPSPLDRDAPEEP